jgi:hypothetical protein
MLEDQKFPFEESDLDLVKGRIAQLFRSKLCKMTPAELRAAAALLLGIDRLPAPTPGLDLAFTISQPNTDGNYGWVDIAVSEEKFRLARGEHFYDSTIE